MAVNFTPFMYCRRPLENKVVKAVHNYMDHV